MSQVPSATRPEGTSSDAPCDLVRPSIARIRASDGPDRRPARSWRPAIPASPPPPAPRRRRPRPLRPRRPGVAVHLPIRAALARVEPRPIGASRRATSSPARSPSPSPTGSASGRNPWSTTPRIKYQPLLPVGTQLQVLDGPVEGSGYQWVRVAPVGVTLDGGVGRWLGRDRRPRRHAVDRAVRSPARRPQRRRGLGEARVSERRRRRARAASELNAFGISLYKRLLADPRPTQGQGRRHVARPASPWRSRWPGRAPRGSTASQMDRVLRANGWNDLGSGLGSLQQILNGHNATWKDDEGTTPLAVAQRRQPGVRPGRLADRAGLSPADRTGVRGRHRPRRLRARQLGRAGPRSTAGWPGRRANRIPKLLSPPDVTAATRLVLVNAVYLKANWAHEFDAGPDQVAPVHQRRRQDHQGPDDAPVRRAERRARDRQRMDRPPSSSTPAPTAPAARDDADPPRQPRGASNAGCPPASSTRITGQDRRRGEAHREDHEPARRRHELRPLRVRRRPVPAEVRDRHPGRASCRS